MLGEIINDPDSVECGGSIRGMGLLKTITNFSKEKTTTQISGKINNIEGFYSQLSGIEIRGYEIHMGNSEITYGVPLSTLDLKSDGCVSGNVAGSYLHGIFDNSQVTNTIVKILAHHKGISLEGSEDFDLNRYRESQYDLLAEEVRKSVDMDKIYKIIGIDQ